MSTPVQTPNGKMNLSGLLTDAKPVQKVFFLNLDGLRFLAFFAVFLFRYFYTLEPEIIAITLYQVPFWLTRSGDSGVIFSSC